jgi:hypothetical protein
LPTARPPETKVIMNLRRERQRDEGVNLLNCAATFLLGGFEGKKKNKHMAVKS